MSSLDEGDFTASPALAWLLLSGGIDSAACAAFYLERGFDVRCLHIDFGQPASRNEQTSARQVAHHYGLPLSILRWTGSGRRTNGEIVGRNAFLLLGALLEIGTGPGVLAIGVHSGTPYFDCSQNFLTTVQAICDGYCNGRVRLAAPFISWSKHQVYLFCKSANVPLHLTYSCEIGTDPICGDCMSCQDRRALYAL